MTSPIRLAALVAVLALVAIGALSLGAGRSAPAPSVAPTTAPASAAVAGPTILSTIGVPVLDQPFTSERNGFTMSYPGGWDVVPATATWVAGDEPRNGLDAAFDTFETSDAHLTVATQRLSPGQTPDDWLHWYCDRRQGAAVGADCTDPTATWPKITVGNSPAYLAVDGQDAVVDGGVSTTMLGLGRRYVAVVPLTSHAYEFAMDGNIDRATFQAFLDTVTLSPVDAVDLPHLDASFTSPANGFTIPMAVDWTADPAAKPWIGLDNQSDMMDAVTVTGTDTSVLGASQSLGGEPYEQFLAGFHANTLANVPAGCDGGDPSTWPELAIGGQTGHLEMLCNAAEALVNVGDRVYVFDWGNDTFDTDRHLSLASWKALLQRVTLTPETAK